MDKLKNIGPIIDPYEIPELMLLNLLIIAVITMRLIYQVKERKM